MIDPSEPYPSATKELSPRARDGAIRAALAGAGAGLAAGLLDTCQAWPEMNGPGQGALLVLQTAGLLAPAGCALAILAWACSFLGARLWRRLGRDPGIGAVWLPTLLAAPPLSWIALRLFQGGVTSQLPARWLLIPAVALVLTAVFNGFVRLALGLIARADRAGQRTSGLLAAAGAILLLACGLRFADAHLYRRLYQFLHL
ncbi:MAG TPA: hypothetical protein VM285_17130, partial [Polyangia bacterium]|nr:hypothetical protein [Polyangia bacterium]